MQDTLDDSDMPDWFCRAAKTNVVLHDRLMTDAALGALPIKTEHSYSLNSDRDSPAISPVGIHTKVDGKKIIVIIKHCVCYFNNIIKVLKLIILFTQV